MHIGEGLLLILSLAVRHGPRLHIVEMALAGFLLDLGLTDSLVELLTQLTADV